MRLLEPVPRPTCQPGCDQGETSAPLVASADGSRRRRLGAEHAEDFIVVALVVMAFSQYFGKAESKANSRPDQLSTRTDRHVPWRGRLAVRARGSGLPPSDAGVPAELERLDGPVEAAARRSPSRSALSRLSRSTWAGSRPLDTGPRRLAGFELDQPAPPTCRASPSYAPPAAGSPGRARTVVFPVARGQRVTCASRTCLPRLPQAAELGPQGCSCSCACWSSCSALARSASRSRASWALSVASSCFAPGPLEGPGLLQLVHLVAKPARCGLRLRPARATPRARSPPCPPLRRRLSALASSDRIQRSFFSQLAGDGIPVHRPVAGGKPERSSRASKLGHGAPRFASRRLELA